MRWDEQFVNPGPRQTETSVECECGADVTIEVFEHLGSVDRTPAECPLCGADLSQVELEWPEYPDV